MNMLKNETGQGLTEYLILLILIAVLSIGAARQLGQTIEGRINAARNQIDDLHVRD